MKKCALYSLAIASVFSSPVFASASEDDAKWQANVNLDIVGGAFANEALSASAGRENQAKLSSAILSTDIDHEWWTARIEFVGAGDEIKADPDSNIYTDIYRNLGTDLYYYGDLPLREAWIGQHFEGAYWQIGRMVSLLGQQVTENTYTTAYQAPNAVIYNTGIFTGMQTGFSFGDDVVKLELGVLSGRDRPCLSGNCYFDGELDPNQKGNNTPVVESMITVNPIDRLSLFAGYLRNKTGSAPGQLTSGKHNDNRTIAGFDAALLKSDHVNINLLGQYNSYLIGLTESGSQGEATPTKSLDITKSGYFATLDFGFPLINSNVQITHETIDRIDAVAWQDVANFDRSHPVFDADEKRLTFNIRHAINDYVTVEAFHRMDEVPYMPGSPGLEETSRSGVLFKFSAPI